MRSSVIIVAHREHGWLERAVASVRDQADEVIVVDNGSGGAVSDAAERAGARARSLPRNLGFPGGVNAGLEVATGDLVALLNDDAMADPGWIASAADELTDEAVGAVTPKLVFALPYAELRFPDQARFVGTDPRSLGRALRSVTLDGRQLLEHLVGPGVHRLEVGDLDGQSGTWRWTTGPDPVYVPLPDGDAAARLLVDGERAPVVAVVSIINSAGTYLSAHGYGGDYGFGAPDDGSFDRSSDRFGGCGAALVTTRRVLEQVGFLAGHFFAYYEDLDWSWRVQLAGLRVRYQPSGIVRHVGGATSGGPQDPAVRALAARNRLLCLARNAPIGRLVPEVRRALSIDPPPRFHATLARSLPRALGQRQALRKRWRRTPEEVWAQWAGVNERWPASAPS